MEMRRQELRGRIARRPEARVKRHAHHLVDLDLAVLVEVPALQQIGDELLRELEEREAAAAQQQREQHAEERGRDAVDAVDLVRAGPLAQVAVDPPAIVGTVSAGALLHLQVGAEL
jgi:hypothetical protein